MQFLKDHNFRASGSCEFRSAAGLVWSGASDALTDHFQGPHCNAATACQPLPQVLKLLRAPWNWSHEFLSNSFPQLNLKPTDVLCAEGAPGSSKIKNAENSAIFPPMGKSGEAPTDSPTQRGEPHIATIATSLNVSLKTRGASSKPKHREAKSGSCHSPGARASRTAWCCSGG